MYVEKEQWLTLLLVGTIFIVSVNIWAIKRDRKGIDALQESEIVYQQIPVIPFTN